MIREESGYPLSAANPAAAKLGRAQFVRLVTEYDGLLYNVSRSMLHCDADCRDAIQEAVIAAWRGLDRLRNPQFFKTWLVRILINQCNAQLRGRRYTAGDGNEPRVESVDEDALSVRRAVESLKPKLRSVVVLYYYEDFSTEEIARTLGIPQGTVKTRLAAARSNLRQILE